MTEYDYSPEAYERYMQTQNRIANWVSQTEQHRPEFGSSSEAAAAESRSRSSRPSLFQRLTHRRQSHSAHEPRHHHHPRRRRDSSSLSSSSSSSSSSETYARSPRSPGPMPIPAFESMSMYPQLQTYHSKNKHSGTGSGSGSGARHRSSSHHRSSHRSPKYVISPPTSPPLAQPYPYPYGTGSTPITTPTSGQVVSPGGPYVYPARPGVSAVAQSPPYIQPQGYYPQTSYPFPPTYPQGQQGQVQQPHTAPATTYAYYPQPQAQAQAQAQAHAQTPPAQHPYPYTYTYPQTAHAAYPPAIYPLTAYTTATGTGAPQQGAYSADRPVFHQRIFSGSGGRKGKSSRRSY